MYFIFDCNGAIVGNPKGYKTFEGAERQADSKKVMQTVIETYNTRVKKNYWDAIRTIRFIPLDVL